MILEPFCVVFGVRGGRARHGTRDIVHGFCLHVHVAIARGANRSQPRVLTGYCLSHWAGENILVFHEVVECGKKPGRLTRERKALAHPLWRLTRLCTEPTIAVIRRDVKTGAGVTNSHMHDFALAVIC
jgi:hypothetical protein